MRVSHWVLALVLAGCTTKSLVPCKDQSTCAPLNAVCLADGFCHHPGDDGLDLAGIDFADPLDAAAMCIDSTTCAAPLAPICDPSSHACRACAIGECPVGKPQCLPTGACVECTTISECEPAQKVCDLPTNTCRACNAHSECASGICDAGKCALAADVAFVDNSTCVSADGSKAHPWCTFAAAIAQAKPYISVVGSVTAYGGFTIPADRAASLLIVGPGRTANPTARIIPNAADSAVITIAPNAGTLPSFGLDGLELVGTPSTAITTTIVYQSVAASTTAISIHDCYLHDSKTYGVEVLGGPVTIDSSVFSGHLSFAVISNGPLHVSRTLFTGNAWGINANGSYVMENIVIANGTAPALSLGASSSGTFRFNTVANNASMGAYPGGSVGGSGQTIEASLFIGNGMQSGSQLMGTYALTNTVVGGDNIAGGIQKTPTFVSTTDRHLVINDVANQSCCVDKSTTGPSVDADNHPRPLGAGYDIGAYEVQ